MEQKNGEGTVIKRYIFAMIRRANVRQLSVIYEFLRSYLKTPLDELQRDVEQAE